MSSHQGGNSKQHDRTHGDGGQREAAGFIAETLTNLSTIARNHRLDVLGYLLDMAQLEANEVLRRTSQHGGKPK